MNSLNILSSRVSPPPSPGPSRSNSLGHVGLAAAPVSSSTEDLGPTDESISTDDRHASISSEPEEIRGHEATGTTDDYFGGQADENAPLLEKNNTKESYNYSWRTVPARITSGVINSVRWVLTTIASPGVYLIACFYDEQGNFAPLRQLKILLGVYGGDARKLATDYHENIAVNEEKGHYATQHGNKGTHSFAASRPSPKSSGSSSSGLSSDSESEMSTSHGPASSSRHARSKTLQPSEESAPSRRSMRIKFNNDDARKHRKTQSVSGKLRAVSGSTDLSAQLKSPTSPVNALTKYPKTPAPPRPLIPRRQPSYVPSDPQDPSRLKTLIIDLDETLIHSMSKGGRIGSGHMVEVRLNTTYVGSGGQQSLGPQHPILYYVHKRPHCDEFLRKVCKWFNLVVFTASVQEYADPVIDWLESERKFFSARYYRQHCTFRHGAFIKDLSSVEPDLSNVMILDNSPLSYMFHQDNAIPIQGWISDPTDNDLLHLVPFLEGLQHVSDVRALLALRGGEDGQYNT